MKTKNCIVPGVHFTFLIRARSASARSGTKNTEMLGERSAPPGICEFYRPRLLSNFQFALGDRLLKIQNGRHKTQKTVYVVYLSFIHTLSGGSLCGSCLYMRDVNFARNLGLLLLTHPNK